MDDQHKAPQVWPRWRWGGSSWWFTVAGAIVGTAVILHPSLMSGSLAQRFAAVLACFVGGPIIVLSVAYMTRLVLVAVKRSAGYQDVANRLSAAESELSQTKAIVAALVENQPDMPRFDVSGVFLYHGAVSISISFAAATLAVGDSVAVVDTEDGMLFGHFEIREVKTKGYRAAPLSINPVWLGYLHELNQPETPAPPSAMAFLVARGKAI